MVSTDDLHNKAQLIENRNIGKSPTKKAKIEIVPVGRVAKTGSFYLPVT